MGENTLIFLLYIMLDKLNGFYFHKYTSTGKTTVIREKWCLYLNEYQYREEWGHMYICHIYVLQILPVKYYNASAFYT